MKDIDVKLFGFESKCKTQSEQTTLTYKDINIMEGIVREKPQIKTSSIGTDPVVFNKISSGTDPIPVNSISRGTDSFQSAFILGNKLVQTDIDSNEVDKKFTYYDSKNRFKLKSIYVQTELEINIKKISLGTSTDFVYIFNSKKEIEQMYLPKSKAIDRNRSINVPNDSSVTGNFDREISLGNTVRKINTGTMTDLSDNISLRRREIDNDYQETKRLNKETMTDYNIGLNSAQKINKHTDTVGFAEPFKRNLNKEILTDMTLKDINELESVVIKTNINSELEKVI